MSARDLVAEALEGLRLYRLRSVLTAASFAAGTAAAIALFAMTDGAAAELIRRIEALGTDLVVVRAVGDEEGEGGPPLTLADASALENAFPFVEAAASLRRLDSSVLLPDGQLSVSVVGVSEGFFELLRTPFLRGAPDALGAGPELPCVLGPAAARELVSGKEAYGSLVKAGGNWYRVVGVLAADLPIPGGSLERTVYLPMRATFRGDPVAAAQAVREIWLRLAAGVDPASVRPVLERALRRRHEGSRGFEVVPPRHLLESRRETRGLLDWLLLAVAGAGFALGGIAMAAVSWQSVSRRSREIAVRRAIGATRRTILAQFLLEGIMLAVAGAVVGLIAGSLVAAVTAAAAGWPWAISPGRLGVTGVLAVGVGGLATLAPAARAARLDPVAALRLLD